MDTSLSRAARLTALLLVFLCALGRVAPAQTLPTVTYANPASGYAGQTIALVASLWSNGSRLSGKSLTFARGASTLGSAITDGLGVARLTYTIPAGTATGSVTITASFAGDTSYLPSSRSFTLTVKLPTITYTNAASGYVGQSITLLASLKSGGVGLSGKTITFAQGASVLGSALTDSQGVARLVYTIPAAAAPGSVTLTASFAGDATYLPSSRSLTLTVKLRTLLYTNPATGSPRHVVALVASLWANGQGVANKTLTYTAGATVLGTAQTDGNGIARLNYTIPVGTFVGTYTLTASFAGDAGYIPSSRSLTLTVTKGASTAIAFVTNSPGVPMFDLATGAFLGNFIANDTGHALIFGSDGLGYLSTAEPVNEVRRYDGKTGAFVDVFVSSGSGGLNNATDLRFGPDGNLYVASAWSNDVKRYNGTTGAYMDNFASGSGLNVPTYMLFASDGKLYVSSSGITSGVSEVKRFDAHTGAFIDNFVSAGSGGLQRPYGLAFGPDGNLYVCSFLTDQILRYNRLTGAFMDAFIPAGTGGLKAPSSMAFGSDGILYVLSGGNFQLKRYNAATGAYIDTLDPTNQAGLYYPDHIMLR